MRLESQLFARRVRFSRRLSPGATVTARFWIS
jgi:hypothetical protein